MEPTVMQEPSAEVTHESDDVAQRDATPVSLQLICDHATAMVDIWDYETYQYVFISNAVKYVTGHDPEDWKRLGVRNIQSIIHPDDRAEVIRVSEKNRQAVAQRQPGIDDSKPFSVVEFRLRCKDGGYVWLHSDSSVYSRTPDGKLKYIVSTSVNIDAQKAYEARLREAARRLQESQSRLREDYEQLQQLDSAKDEFVSIASHQLRTPATGIKQYLGLLLQDRQDRLGDEQRQALRAAVELNDRQLKIVDELLITAKTDGGRVQLHRENAPLNALAAGVVEEQHSKAKARHQTVTFQSTDQGVATVSMDSFLVRMVLENLVDNARKYSADGDSVAVRLWTDHDYATVEVQDHGIGIAKQDQGKLFQKYSRIQNSKTQRIDGTGLGLYWAKHIIDLHGGNLRLAHSSPAGSTFAFSLPLVRSDVSKKKRQ